MQHERVRASSVPTRAWMPLIEDNFRRWHQLRDQCPLRVDASIEENHGTSSDESVVGAWGGPLTPNSSRALRRVASDTQGGVDSGTYKVVSDLLERKSGEHADTEAKAAASDEKLRELRAQVDGLQRQLEDARNVETLCCSGNSMNFASGVIGLSRDIVRRYLRTFEGTFVRNF